jgi:membrane protease subunit HflK
VQYRISDPRAFLFNVVDPDSTIQEVAAGALSDVVGKMKLDDVLTTGREMLSSGVLERTKQVLASYNAGLEVTAVTLRKVQAPDQVQVAFNDVNRADQDKATYVQQAQAYASKVVPLAQGVAARILADATAYQQQSILGAQAQVAKYEALLSAYKTAPDLMRERMYLETMQTVFQNTSKILVDANTGNNILYLPIDKVMQAAREEEASADNTNAANQSATSLATAQAQVSDAASTQSSTNSDQSAGTEVK